MINMNSNAIIQNLNKHMQALKESLFGKTKSYRVNRMYKGEINGVSFYDDDNDKPRLTPRLYIDTDDDISVGHHHVIILEID